MAAVEDLEQSKRARWMAGPGRELFGAAFRGAVELIDVSEFEILRDPTISPTYRDYLAEVRQTHWHSSGVDLEKTMRHLTVALAEATTYATQCVAPNLYQDLAEGLQHLAIGNFYPNRFWDHYKDSVGFAFRFSAKSAADSLWVAKHRPPEPNARVGEHVGYGHKLATLMSEPLFANKIVRPPARTGRGALDPWTGWIIPFNDNTIIELEDGVDPDVPIPLTGSSFQHSEYFRHLLQINRQDKAFSSGCPLIAVEEAVRELTKTSGVELSSFLTGAATRFAMKDAFPQLAILDHSEPVQLTLER